MNMSSTNGFKKVSDLVGKSYNRLTVVEYLGVGKHRKHHWLCRCICGEFITLNTSRITGNDPTRSCGCLRKETMRSNRCDRVRHGLSTHKLYQVFHSMNSRCSNPKSQRWKYYGGKGVTVSWGSFQEFYNWAMSNGYKEGLSIDRIDSNGNYDPNNCHWIPVSENTRKAHLGKSRRNETTTS